MDNKRLLQKAKKVLIIVVIICVIAFLIWQFVSFIITIWSQPYTGIGGKIFETIFLLIAVGIGLWVISNILE